MWTEIKKNGTIKYCERYMDPLSEKLKKVAVIMPKDTPQNRNKAIKLLNAKIEEALKCTKINTKITLGDLQEIYIQNQEILYKKSTTKRNNIILTSVIKLLGGDTLVDNITAQYLNEKLLKSGKPISTLNTYITRLKAMINWGYQNDYHDNYQLIRKMKPFEDAVPADTADQYLEPAEIAKLLEYIRSKNHWHWYYATKILILTGLRTGELIALEDTDVDLQNKVIHVTKTYDTINKIITTPKTDNSVRDVHIQPELETVIRRCRIWRKEKLLEQGLRSDLFLPDIHTGSYMSHAAYGKYLREATETVLGHRITPHKLRHTHASLLAAAGMTPDEIARRLGHSHSDITQDIYIHVTEQVVINDNKKMDKINFL